VADAVGVDPSPVFVARAREFAARLDRVSFEVGDGRELRFANDDFDVVVFHTTLTHIPQPERALAEAFRVLRPGGTLAVFDGDYATITVAIDELDPLQTCIEAVKGEFLHDPWLVRRLPALLRSAGFTLVGCRSHGYVQTEHPEYMLSLMDRGADALSTSGRIGTELSAGLKSEARRRAEAGMFFGFIAFASLLARKIRE
jgi:SAM-dependent methyltransferase